jgi:hypothetical protein
LEEWKLYSILRGKRKGKKRRKKKKSNTVERAYGVLSLNLFLCSHCEI